MVWLEFLLCLVVILFAGTKLARYGDTIAQKTGFPLVPENQRPLVDILIIGGYHSTLSGGHHLGRIKRESSASTKTPRLFAIQRAPMSMSRILN